jgi:hypothetical protein
MATRTAAVSPPAAARIHRAQELAELRSPDSCAATPDVWERVCFRVIVRKSPEPCSPLVEQKSKSGARYVFLSTGYGDLPTEVPVKVRQKSYDVRKAFSHSRI